MPAEHFYRDLPVLPAFENGVDSSTHVDVPADWWVVIADVTGSTEAIARGAYKDVNTVGVACIAALLNVDRSIELPYVFGGDGATFAIPDCLRERIVVALRGTQRMARDAFRLTLRAGLIRAGDLQRADYWVRLARIRTSRHLAQPVFSGRGWDVAERRVKAGDDPEVLYVTPDGGPAEADFSGFECRWQNVPSFRDHKLALIVTVSEADPSAHRAAVLRIEARLRSIFGDLGDHHPLRREGLRLSFSPRQLAGEWRVRGNALGALARFACGLSIFGQNLLGRLLFALAGKRGVWGRYRDEVVENSDFRKFDGALRMVLDATSAQVAELGAWLDAEYAAGRLVYGLYTSPHALVTCLVESRAGRHVHFVDGSDGGYALAARELKRRLAGRAAAKNGQA